MSTDDERTAWNTDPERSPVYAEPTAPVPDLKEPFSSTRDDQHPVRWSPADGDTPAYLTLKGAVERLAGYGHDPVEAEARLRRHQPIRTPFAFYMIDEEA